MKNVEERQWLWEAAKLGLIHGVAPGEIAPDGVTTRAQSITILNRVLDLKDGKTLPVNKYAVSAAEIYWHKTNIMTMLPRYFAKTNNGERFHDELLSTSTSDGNISCTVDKYVVVVLDDPNDLNKHLVPAGLQWQDLRNRVMLD